MSRPAYRITEEDRYFAKQWIYAKREDTGFLWSQGAGAQGMENRINALGALEETEDAPEALNAWCERWMNDKEWRQMKDAIRAARRRWRLQTSAEKPVGVVLSREAHSILERIAKRDRVTLSRVVEKYLVKEAGKG